MPLEHDPTPRFNPEQRDAILDLAARLQAQHEATVGADELMRAAEEAGLDPRFVQEAAMRMNEAPRPLPRSLLVPLSLFVVQGGFFVFIQNPSVAGGRSISAFELAFAVMIAFFLGLWAARERSVRPFVPLVPLGVSVALFGATTFGTALNGAHPVWLFQHCVVFGFVQAVAALFGAFASAGIDRLDHPSGDRRAT